MRTALPKGLVRVNLNVLKRRESRFDFLILETEASSDSEVVRQSLRYYEQLVQDALHNIKLKATIGTETYWVTVGQFADNPMGTYEFERRTLILHERSVERLKGLCAALQTPDSSEVVRAALRYYAYLVEKSLLGAIFFAELPSGEIYQVRLGLSVQPPNRGLI